MIVAVGSFSTSAEAEVSPQDEVPSGTTETTNCLESEVELELGMYKWKSAKYQCHLFTLVYLTLLLERVFTSFLSWQWGRGTIKLKIAPRVPPWIYLISFYYVSTALHHHLLTVFPYLKGGRVS